MQGVKQWIYNNNYVNLTFKGQNTSRDFIKTYEG
jgi:hypothetical protein